jgi:DNA mismatch repair protein MutL
MSKIRCFRTSLANKIAAGEVVERPASVVKELVENSLDAGALSIKVAAEGFGCKLVAVLDDGEGMDPDDAMLCLEPHATSKIFKDEDIEGIRSFGFRGEAMPSIAAVSRMSVRTRRRESLEGVEVLVHGGKMISSRPAGCAPGTEIRVCDLFYNTPARRKFLRTPATEERHIVETVSLLALSHPQVGFELKLDGSVALSTPACGENLIVRVQAVFGRDFADAMVPLSWSAHGVKVSGFVARRGYTKPSRSDQKVFINGRPVDSLPVYRGLKEGCGPMLDRGRHHPCVMFLSMDPTLVDVNVHPAKREIRFRREYDVVAAVREAVANALREASAAASGLDVEAIADNAGSAVDLDFKPLPRRTPNRGRPSLFLSARGLRSSGRGPSPFDRVMNAAHVEYLPSAVAGLLKLKSAAELQGPSGPMRQGELLPPAPAPVHEESPAIFHLRQESAEERSFPGSSGLRLLGVVDASYIVAAMPGGMVVIDQHAAHERILFEKLLKGVDGSKSQRLLIPIVVDVGRADLAFLSKNSAPFAGLGFEIEPFGQTTLKINAIPAALKQCDAGGLFKELLSSLSEGGWRTGLVSGEAIARAACKAAVKARDHLSPEEAASLIKQMAKCEQPFTCPHGRPTVINISVKELERRFGRK